MQKYINQLKKQVLFVLIAVMAMSVFVPAHVLVYGQTQNRHPFAIKLQNIIDDMISGFYYLDGVALINLDERGEQQGVVFIVRTRPLDMGDGFYLEEMFRYLLWMSNDEMQIDRAEYAISEHSIVTYGLTENGMLMSQEVFGWGGDVDRTIRTLYSIRDGNLGTQSVLIDNLEQGNYFSVDWEAVTETITNNYSRFYDVIAWDTRYGQLLQEWGNASPLPDQAAQILAMQAPATMPTQPTTTAPTQNDAITVTINDTPVIFADQPPVIVNGRTLVPVRGVFEALGFDVTWNEQTRQATLSRADATIVITINSATFTTNGISHILDVPAQVIGGRTMLPIRAVLESMGYDLGWEEATRTVLIVTNYQ